MPAVVLAIANQKGGVGKTTTTVNVASALSIQGIPTLIVDMDPQGNATSSLGLEKKPGKGVYEPLLSGSDLSSRVISSGRKNLWIVPSELDLAAAELELSSQENYLIKLRASINRLKNEYGLRCILIDCPPSLGLLTLNALTSSDSVLIPIQCEYYALEGLGQLLNTVRLVQQQLNTNLEIEGVLLTMYDQRLNLSKQVADEVRSFFDDKVFETIIQRNVRLSEAPSFGKPALMYAANSMGAQNYLDLVEEILKNGN